jgi:hypothetical protein
MQRNEWIEMITVPEVPQVLAAGRRFAKIGLQRNKAAQMPPQQIGGFVRACG